MGLIKIHLEERHGGSLSPRTLVSIVQRSEAKLGQACKASRTYIKVQRSGAELGQALSLAYVLS